MDAWLQSPVVTGFYVLALMKLHDSYLAILGLI